jgi:hypothetical protein
VRRLASHCIFITLFCLSPATQASVLGDLSQSLLSGPSPDLLADYARLTPISASSFYADPADMPNHLLPGPGSDAHSPGLFLMPVGRSDEVGLGLGVRFPF